MSTAVNRALVLPTGQVQLKFGSIMQIACNGTAWETFLKNNAGGNSKGASQLPTTYKCSFDMSSELYDTSVINFNVT